MSQPFAPALAITIAADHVSKLRQMDVWRVLEQGAETCEQRRMLADYITENRPDLAAEVVSSMSEIGEVAP